MRNHAKPIVYVAFAFVTKSAIDWARERNDRPQFAEMRHSPSGPFRPETNQPAFRVRYEIDMFPPES
jgi:hypothetical protein